MYYNEVEKKYFVIVPIQRDCSEILVCRNIKNGEYAFLINNNGDYQPVSKEIEDQLSLIYKIDDGKIVPLLIDNTINDKATISNKYETCKNLIFALCDKIKCGRIEEIKQNFNDVVICHRYDNYLTKANNVCAYFDPISFSINVRNEKLNLQILLHEMLHCASRSEKGLGFSNVVLGQMEGKVACSSFNVGYGINEGATEFFVNLITGTNSGAYTFASNMFANLYKQCNSRLIANAYFNSDLFALFKEIKKTYKLPNIFLAKKFIYQIDAIFTIEKNDLNHITKNDYDNLMFECYKTYFEMLACKYKLQNIDSLNIDEVFTEKCLYNYAKKYYEAIKPELIKYYELYTLPIGKKSANVEEYISRVILLIHDRQLDGRYFPEHLKTASIFHTLLHTATKIIKVINKNEFEVEDISRDISKVILDPKNNYLPKDIIKRNSLLSSLISSSKEYGFNILEDISTNDLVTMIKCDINQCYIIAGHDHDYFVKNVMPNMDVNDLVNEKFVMMMANLIINSKLDSASEYKYLYKETILKINPVIALDAVGMLEEKITMLQDKIKTQIEKNYNKFKKIINYKPDNKLNDNKSVNNNVDNKDNKDEQAM